MTKISVRSSEPRVSSGDEGALRPAESAATRLRWLILASLGPVAAGACGGRSFATDLEDDGVGVSVGGTGGSGASAMGGASYGGLGGTSSGGQGGSFSVGGSAGYGGSGYGGSGGASVGNTGGSFGVPMPGYLPGECLMATELGGGFQRCETGQLHRPSIGTCASPLPRVLAFSEEELLAIHAAAIERGIVEQLPGILPCADDLQCTALPNGYCEATPNDDELTECRYGCVSDSQCESGSVCLCGDPVGTCVPALCDSDAECTGDLRCAAYDPAPGCTSFSLLPVFKCQSYQDECAHAGHCPPGAPYCTSVGDRFACVSGGCAVPGRPFLVGALPRLAGSAPRADFSERGALADAPLHPLVADDAELRIDLAQAWTRIGLMEHASIAAFARFALQLLALGAPPELLTSTARAIEDETRHARSCFALARRYSGADVGPGPLDVSDAIGACDLREAVLTSIDEGCIGETLAALEAAEAAQHCIDPLTRALLQDIARDEAEHAALAWRFVAWALPRCSDAIVAEVRAKFRRALAEEPRRASAIDRSERELLHFGVVGPRVSAQLRRSALRETLRPCAEALLGSLSLERAPRAPAPAAS